MSSYVESILTADLDDLIIGFCNIDLPESTRLAHIAMPELLDAILAAYELRGLELIDYILPEWVESYITDNETRFDFETII
jgi:hypothetical protein